MYKHFKPEEFFCKCGNQHDQVVSAALLAKLDNAREQAGIPFIITSGYRCAKHNQAVGGAADSAHLVGKAADIRAQTPIERYRIVQALLDQQITRLGIYPTHVHADIDETLPPEVLWL